MGTQFINVNFIDPDPNQPRKNKPVEYLRDELATSIAHRGLHNPIHVVENSDHPGRYLIKNGECRWTAVSGFLAGIVKKENLPLEKDGWRIEDGELFIEAKVVEKGSDKDFFIDQIMDNNVRKAMTPLETIHAYKRALELGSDLDELEKAFGTSAKTIEADLEILNLPDGLLRTFDEGKIPKAVARRLGVMGNQSKMVKAWSWAVKGRGVDGMLAKIEAYISTSNQQDIFGEVVREMSKDEKKKVKAEWARFANAVGKFKESPYSNGKFKHVVVLKSRQLTELEETARMLKEIQENIMSQLREYKAQNKNAVA